MKKSFFINTASMALFSGAIVGLSVSPVLAQTWDGPGAQPVVYNTHQIGDGSTPSGGTPSAYAIAPAERPTLHNTTGFKYTITNGINTSTEELKFRILCGTSHTNMADFILAPGVAKWMHKHTYAGNTSTNQNSTYASLRDWKFSTCMGGPLWNQPYWDPSVCKQAGTQLQCLKPDSHLFYYFRGRDKLGTLTSLPPFTRVIFGRNPFDMDNAEVAREIPAGYVSKTMDGWGGWDCFEANANGDAIRTIPTVDGGTFYPALVTPSGGDPWNGGCKAGYRLTANLGAPPCWDAKNTTSPNGRRHFRFKIYLASNQGGDGFCPDNWVDVPDLTVRVSFSLKKDAEYHVDEWFVSSDRMDPDPAKWHPRGSTFHADWALAVDPDTWHKVMANCLGIPWPGYTPVGGDCGTGAISATEQLEANTAPAGSGYTTPIMDGRPKNGLAAKNRWFPLEDGHKGPFHIMGH